MELESILFSVRLHIIGKKKMGRANNNNGRHSQIIAASDTKDISKQAMCVRKLITWYLSRPEVTAKGDECVV